jgi:predicted RNA-binding protein with PUA domain
MIFEKNKIPKINGVINGKRIEIISNSEAIIVVSVNGELHTISTVGKSDKELGNEIRKL